VRIYRMDAPANRDRALGIIATATVLALLYFARDVLVPITLAIILSLLIAPLVRGLRRLGLGQTLSVLAAVLVMALSFAAVAGVIGSQFVHMAASLPRYERTVEHKLRTLNNLTLAKVNALTGQAQHLANRHLDTDQPATPGQPAAQDRPAAFDQLEVSRSTIPIPVELHQPPPNSLQVIEKVLGSVWVPIETAAIVLVVLVFVLLEHEALRDRFIRIAGGSDIRLTTPLTLCLLVAGRHIKALSLLDVLLGDTQALTMPERFYQRALSADSPEIIAGARLFLKRNSFANYCDLVLMPALHLARIDLMAGAISIHQQLKVRSAMVAVIAALGGEKQKFPRRNRQSSVLDGSNAGRLLRQQRELVSGRWQGPLMVPPGSVMVCVGLGSMADELATELLVRILRDQKIDARHMSLDDLGEAPPPPFPSSTWSAPFPAKSAAAAMKRSRRCAAVSLARAWSRCCCPGCCCSLTSVPIVCAAPTKPRPRSATRFKSVSNCIVR
jgi:hypothetical protein